MKNKIRVLMFEPLKVPNVKYIDNSREEFEKIVDGEIHHQRLDKKTLLVHNKNGKQLEFIPNRHVGVDTICGNFFIVSDAGDGNYASISSEQAQYYFSLLHEAEVISQQEIKEDLALGFDAITKDTVFINNLNMRITEEKIDVTKAADSYKSEDKTEAKDLLKSMVEAFKDTYSVTDIDKIASDGEGFIHLPAVIKGCKSGALCVGLVYVDLQSSGELHNVQFALPGGFYEEYDKDMPKEAKNVRKEIGEYDYWYPFDYSGDIHTNFNNVPDDVQKMLDYARESEEQEHGINMK